MYPCQVRPSMAHVAWLGKRSLALKAPHRLEPKWPENYGEYTTLRRVLHKKNARGLSLGEYLGDFLQNARIGYASVDYLESFLQGSGGEGEPFRKAASHFESASQF